jgi:hypothetical protein
MDRRFLAVSARRGSIDIMAARRKWEGCGLHGIACPDGPLFKCAAIGVAADGSAWDCDRRRAAPDEYCDAHRVQRERGRALTPLDGP